MTDRDRFRLAGAWALGALAALSFLACDEAPLSSPEAPNLGKGGTGPTVTSTNPAYGYDGTTGLVVTIAGSGFSPGAAASWERNGAADPKISVRSTAYVSSTQLQATIDIASDATISLYDVAVYAGGKKGIGSELFEVTTAISISGWDRLPRATSDQGDIAGQGPNFWSPATGLQSLSTSSGSAWGVSEDGRTVAGGLGIGTTGSLPYVWTRSGTGWAQAALPISAGAGNARAVASDPVTGAATAIGGVETILLKGNKFRREPRLWLASGGAWQLTALPGTAGGTEGQVSDVNPGLLAVGNTPAGATVWTPNGSGGWTAAVIGPVGSDVDAVNSAGTLAVGESGGVAVYWQLSGGAWSGPVALPGGCARGTGVDDFGRIVAQVCPVPPKNIRVTSVVVLPPYGAGDLTYLPGFGNLSYGSQVEAISRQGHWITGKATFNSSSFGAAFWNLF